MKHIDVPKSDKFKTNPFAKKYAAKNDARHAALEKAKSGKAAHESKEAIPHYLKRK